jgi:phosphoribosylglycinamide formyltransferase-1
MTRIALFASGNGTNAENLIRHLTKGQAVVLLCNNPQAPVLERARKLGIPAEVFTAEQLQNPKAEPSVLSILRSYDVELLVLAGFLWKIPKHLLQAYPGRILNIHPALLPAFGGKGMYGMHVHRAVLDHLRNRPASASTPPYGVSGITIHLIDNHYDRGQMLFQATCPVDRNDTPESLAQKVHALEYKYFPHVVDHYIDTALTRNKL